VETIEVGESEGNKGTPDSLTLTSPTLKKEKDIKREKDIKKELLKTEHRDTIHRTKDAKMAESELVRDLKAQLKYVSLSKIFKILSYAIHYQYFYCSKICNFKKKLCIINKYLISERL